MAPEPLSEVAAGGDRRQTLEAVRAVIAEAIDAGPSPRDLASLTHRLLEVVFEIDALASVDDELAQMLSIPRLDDE
jgi:hypothetical protein